MGRWLDINGEAIYGTRPWKVFGEATAELNRAKDTKSRHTINSRGIRFTRSPDEKHVYAILLECPQKAVEIQSLRNENVASLELLGSPEKLTWSTGQEGLVVDLPTAKPCSHAYVVKVIYDHDKDPGPRTP